MRDEARRLCNPVSPCVGCEKEKVGECETFYNPLRVRSDGLITVIVRHRARMFILISDLIASRIQDGRPDGTH